MEKYSLSDQIFIVWGGNLSLAEKLSKRLKSKGYSCQIGGNAESADSNYFLGPRVLEQMNRSSRAIILANPTFDSHSGRAKFRENLMFEWGYLLGRMPSQYISVYLIGCD